MLASIARKISRIGLLTSIQSTKDIYREYLAVYLLEWLQNLPQKVMGFQTVKGVQMDSAMLQVRRTICEELMNPYQLADEPEVSSLNLWKSSRTDYILMYGHCLWKRPRLLLKQLLIGTLIVHGDEFKIWLGVRYGTHYLSIAKDFLVDQEEFEVSMLSLAVQLFSVPSISTCLVRETNVIFDILVLLKAYYMQDNYSVEVDLTEDFVESILFAQNTILPKYETFDCSGSHMSSSKPLYFFSDLDYIIGAFQSTSSYQDIFNINKTGAKKSNFKEFLDLMTFLQGMHSQKRALVVHVEYEFESFANPFNVSRLVMKTIKLASDSYYIRSNENDVVQLLYLISEVMDTLYTWTLQEHWELISHVRMVDTLTPVSPTGFHEVNLCGETIRIPDRRVGFQPVSIHHPLHWLLSSLLMQIPKVTKNIKNPKVMNHINSEIFSDEARTLEAEPMQSTDLLSIEEMSAQLSKADRHLLIFDYPLQAIVFASQARAGLWVRNGATIRAQVLHFKDLTLRDCYDRNIFLLQFSSMKFGGDVFLTSVIDRYGILEWFRLGEVGLKFDPDQTLALVEDFFYLIIILLTERSYLGASSAKEVIVQEMIHQLAVHENGIAYSQLSQRLATSIEVGNPHVHDDDYESFDTVLHSLANFKYPDGIADHGVYTLKEENYQHVNSYYWHYTRNQREEVEEILRKRFKRGRDLEELVLNLPKIKQVSPGIGFEKIGGMIESRTFCHLILITLWKVTGPLIETPGGKILHEGVWSHLIQLLLVAVEIVKTETYLENRCDFFNNAESVKIEISVNSEPRMTSLLDLILCLVDRANENDVKEFAPRLRYIVRHFENFGSSVVKTVISGWRDKSNWSFFDQPRPETSMDEDDLTTSEKKKMAAKARQAAIMAQFAQAQSSFLANHGDEMDDIEDEFAENSDEELVADEEFPNTRKRNSRKAFALFAKRKQVKATRNMGCYVCSRPVTSFATSILPMKEIYNKYFQPRSRSTMKLKEFLSRFRAVQAKKRWTFSQSKPFTIEMVLESKQLVLLQRLADI